MAASWVKDKKEKPQVYRAEIFLFNDILLICTKIKEKDRDTSTDIESRAKYYKFEVCLFLVELNSVEKIEDRKEESKYLHHFREYYTIINCVIRWPCYYSP